MKVIIKESTAELVEKKSRFIASIFYVENVEAAEKKLEEVRKKHYDAKHNCFAYTIGKNGETVKSSDDGEPSGTAGHPMLDILKGKDLTNCIAIVTRYFGGTLLGTGGLVRCYSDSLKMALDKVEYSEVSCGYEVQFDVSYDDYGAVERMMADAIILSKDFSEKVSLKLLIKDIAFDSFATSLKNTTNGKVLLEKKDKIYYYMDNNKVKYMV